MSPLLQRIAERQMIVCLGSGGVGKTTTSAALALALAAAGKRVAVVTIDPALRLADALGLSELGNTPQPVDPTPFAAFDLPITGQLHAMMLDATGTIDDLIVAIATDRQQAQALLDNRLYHHLSRMVGGTQEFAAIAALHDLHTSGHYDTIVLDTPPSRDAIEFLEAPARLTNFIEGRGLRLLLAPTGLATRIAARQTLFALRAFGHLTGSTLLADIQAFFAASGTIIEAFHARSHAVQRLLTDRQTTFLIVCSPEPEAATEAKYIAALLAARQLTLGGLIVNRLTPPTPPPPSEQQLAAALADDLRLAAKVSRAASERAARAARDDRIVTQLRQNTGAQRPALIAEFPPQPALQRLVAIARILATEQN